MTIALRCLLFKPRNIITTSNFPQNSVRVRIGLTPFANRTYTVCERGQGSSLAHCKACTESQKIGSKPCRIS